MARPESALDAEVRLDGAGAVVRLTGELDASTCDELRVRLEALAADGYQDFTLDLSDLEFVDSSGLAVLVTVHKRLDERGGAIRIVEPSAAVLRVLEMTGLSRLLLR